MNDAAKGVASLNEASGGASPAGDAVCLPTDPYPGLRPFLNHESSLLLGRERQVREVIERLQQTQFVAVIGGSGSGKSSLVLAGVVPELRSFGIPGAGDFWLPMTCTPGTNLSASDAAQSVNTPVTRLAWKFAKLLKPAASPEAEAARLLEIANVFRQESGFARLVDVYADELLVRTGPAASDLRLLFVIDQFEELFHPTNQGIEDVRLMVERVIDHFFSPHPRCYLVLTMRSEHLNDCAGYLELPDAINKSSYLVRRLDEDELRAAIVGPSQRYLRLLQRRDAADAPALPASVEFEPRVLERLMRDVSAITHDPDHLPLLQHLLARLWESAFEREGLGGGVPSVIAWPDLDRAVQGVRGALDAPLRDGVHVPLNDQTNTLRASLENWAEAVYARHTPAQRAELDTVLRRLALKDPNTGMYTQQRIDVDDPALFGGSVAQPRAKLRALVEDGFIGSVDYLFWDDENPQRVTLKVSHESFIRGWSRFRRWADEEDRQFQVYLRLLDDCGRWLRSGRAEKALSTGETLRVYQDCGLDTALDGPDATARFSRLLAMDRDGQRVAPMAGEALAFLRQSLANRDQRAADRANADERRRRRRGITAVIVFAIAGIGVWALAEQLLARKERTLHRSYALAAETQVAFQPQFAGFDAMQPPLLASLMGARFLQQGDAMVVGPAQFPPLSVAVYPARLAGLARTELLGQVRNIAALRTVLLGGAWPVAETGNASGNAIAAPAPRPCASAAFGPDDSGRGFEGARFYARPAPDDEHGLIVTALAAEGAAASAGGAAQGAEGVSVFAGHMARGSDACRIESQLISTPPLASGGARVTVGLAADLSNLVFFFPDYVQFHAILWGDARSVQLRQRAVVVNPALGDDAPREPVAQLASRAGPFATDLRVGARTLRLFDLEPTPIGASQARGTGSAAMVAAAPGSVCAAFAEAMKLPPDEQVLTAPPAASDAKLTPCLHVKPARGVPPGAAAPYLATLYTFRDAANARDTEMQAPLLRELVVGSARPSEFRIDATAGWLAFTPDSREWRAVPWSVPAWRGLAKDVFVPKPAGSAWADAGLLKLIVGDENAGVATLPAWLAEAPGLPIKWVAGRE